MRASLGLWGGIIRKEGEAWQSQPSQSVEAAPFARALAGAPGPYPGRRNI